MPVSYWIILRGTIIGYWGSEKRYILTTEDHHTCIAYEHIYATKSICFAVNLLKHLR